MMRILCLHGKMQTGEILSGRLGTLRRKLKKTAYLHFVDAPFILPPTSPGDTNESRTWFFREKEGTTLISPPSIEESLLMLESEWSLNGPYIGIVAFSMGGCVATAMAALPGRFPGCRFVVTAGSPDVDIEALMAANICQKHETDGMIPHSLASFHFAGLQDVAVPVASSRNLSSRYNPSLCTFVEHEQGHCFPSKATLVDQCVEFINRCAQRHPSQDAGHRVEPIQHIEQPVPKESIIEPSLEDKEQQMEEVEVLSAIYADDVSVWLSDMDEKPIDVAEYVSAGVLSGKEVISIRLNPLEDTTTMMPEKWKGQFTLNIRRPYNYPSAAGPVIDIDLGQLSLYDINTSLQNSLRNTIKKIANDSIGEPSIMSCVQAANDWLCTYHSDSVVVDRNSQWEETAAASPSIGDHTDVALVGDCRENNEEDEMATSEIIRNVSLLAGQQMVKIRRSGLRADAINYRSSGVTIDAAALDASASAKGVWNYTVGLVGKPSAGKSTFYNVATRAALSRDGRLTAAVASHPFTTIEPNVGPGWWKSNLEAKYAPGAVDLHHKGSRYGRDHNGDRILPLVVKDVAGLVPGAYKGRGKGNRFLGDLCDADVLVHVVDASGKSDRDGNAVDELSAGSTPIEDARWIREELHRWIYGNIRAKWSSVVHRSSDSALHRLVQLFSGYQGPRACIISAVKYAELDIGQIGKWSALDLHKLVAQYLSIRFPTCLALNKIDRMDDEQREKLSIWQREIEEMGEVAVPICAVGENWNLLREVGKNVNSLKIDDTESSFDQIRYNRLQNIFGSDCLRGVLSAISAAVALRPPVLCFPVSDLVTEMPIGWHSGVVSSHERKADISPLNDCLLLKPGSSVEDVFNALKRGELPHVHLSGDFVRAEGRSLDINSRKKQLGRDSVIDETNCVIKVQTNRKSVWQTESKLVSV